MKVILNKGIFGATTPLPQGADLYAQEKDFKKAQELLIAVFDGI